MASKQNDSPSVSLDAWQEAWQRHWKKTGFTSYELHLPDSEAAPFMQPRRRSTWRS